MTIKQLRARLDRLERLVKLNETKAEERKLPYEFSIDPALAKAIRDDYKRLEELEKKDLIAFWKRRARNHPDPPEERMLHARIAERARTISCPAGYGFNEAWDDRMRVSIRGSEEDWPWLAHLTPLKDDAAEAQSIARIEAFNQSPEGRARERIRSLDHIKWPSAEELSERDRLLTLYPEPNCHPKHPMRDQIEAWGRAARGQLPVPESR
jgi:hypothetical protein